MNIEIKETKLIDQEFDKFWTARNKAVWNQLAEETRAKKSFEAGFRLGVNIGGAFILQQFEKELASLNKK